MSKENPTEWEMFKKNCSYRHNYIYCSLAGYSPYWCGKKLCRGKNKKAIQEYEDFCDKVHNCKE